MAGLYDRIGANVNSINSHDLSALITALGLGDVTASQVTAILTDLSGSPLDAESAADFAAISVALDTSSDKSAYLLGMQSVFHLVERRIPEITDLVFRTRLGI